jgi:hypothetical protein
MVEYGKISNSKQQISALWVAEFIPLSGFREKKHENGNLITGNLVQVVFVRLFLLTGMTGLLK